MTIPTLSPELCTPKIKWCEKDLKLVTKILMKINRCNHQDPESMANFIKSIAYNYAVRQEKMGYAPSMVGTGGWYVTFIQGESEDFNYVAEVTLMPYVVAKHLEMLDH